MRVQVFDDVITAVEEKPGDVQVAIDRLHSVGKMHRSKVRKRGQLETSDVPASPFLSYGSLDRHQRYTGLSERALGLPLWAWCDNGHFLSRKSVDRCRRVPS